MTHHEEDEQPLDPAMERLRGRMLRLMLISIGIMGVGIFAVFFAIIYKIGQMDEGPASGQDMVETNLELPAGSQIVSSSTDNGRLVVHVDLPDGSAQFLIVDTVSGKLVARLSQR